MTALIALIDWQHPSNMQSILPALLQRAPGYTAERCFTYVTEHIALGMLPTRDSHTSAPLVSANERYCVVTDARIDNRAELARTLQCTEQTPSNDSDWILAAYQRWGPNCAQHLIGDYSFIIWDCIERTVFAARDALGMCSLHYANVGTQLCIATQAQQLLGHPQLSTQCNPAALSAWMRGQPDPLQSMFTGVEVLPSGHHLIASATQQRVQAYWQLDASHAVRYRDNAEYAQHLNELLHRCVGDRMRPDRAKVACQMSGGMDSTSITALAQQQTQRQGRDLLVISHTYADHPSCDESELIHATAQQLQLREHHLLATQPYLAMDYTQLYPPTLESPGIVGSPRYTDELALIKQLGAELLLTGSGGDEMTWGHSASYTNRWRAGDWSVLREIMQGCRTHDLPLLKTLVQLLLIPSLPTALKTQLKRLRPSSSQASNQPAWMLQAPAPVNALYQFANPVLQARSAALYNSSTMHSVRSYEHAAALQGVQVTHPFFDRRLAEFSFSIPDDLWNRQGYPKWLLRTTMSPHLPQAVCWKQQKVTFDGFFGQLLQAQAPLIRKLLADTRLAELGIVDTARLLHAFDTTIHAAQPKLPVELLYAVMTQVWFQKYAHLWGM